MIAGWYERNGPPPEVLKVDEMPDPQPGPNEVRVQLKTSGVNPSDVKTRMGLRKKMSYPRIVPGCDGAGIIDHVGPGVSEKRIGERVWTFEAQWNRPFGTSARYVVLPERLVAPLPAALSFEEGACLGVPYMTAHRAVFADGSITGATVLVQGGAGVVAHYAIQLAKWGGATVISTVSNDDKAAHARKAGADHVINYKTERVNEKVMDTTGGHGVDRVIEVEFGQNIALDHDVIKAYGTIAVYGSQANPEGRIPYFEMNGKNPLIRLILVYTMPAAAKMHAMRDLEPWTAARKPVFAIAKRFPLERIVQAHETVESGNKIGHVVMGIE